MEHLTKQQLVLLTLLVSFVTSIATGIVLVSLLDQAPPAVTQTINRVVEKTIERVVQVPNQATVVTKETVVVRADDLVVSAVEKNAKSLMRIKKVVGAGESRNEIVVGLGLIMSKDGLVATDLSVLNEQYDEVGTPVPQSFLSFLSDDPIGEFKIVGVDAENDIVLLKIVLSEKLKGMSFVPPTLGDANLLKLGQTVIALGGEEKNTVATGIVASMAERMVAEAAATSTDLKKGLTERRVVDLLRTSSDAATTFTGTILLNLSGEVIGIKADPQSGNRHVYLPINRVRASVSKILSAVPPTAP